MPHNGFYFCFVLDVRCSAFHEVDCMKRYIRGIRQARADVLAKLSIICAFDLYTEKNEAERALQKIQKTNVQNIF